MGVQIAPCEGAIFKGKEMPGHACDDTDISCVNLAEPIEMPFGLWTQRHELVGVLTVTP